MPHDRTPEINGLALKAARNKKGIEIKELATQCCLSSKMIAELEDGGMTSFYNHQLKVSAAKRVGSYLGLSTEDYLELHNDVANTLNDINVERIEPAEEKKQILESAPQSVVDEGEQLDDLIYESTNSGTSMPHVKRAASTKWIAPSLVVLLGAFMIYGIHDQVNVDGKAFNLFGFGDAKQKINPESPKEIVAQEPIAPQESTVEEKSPIKPEIKTDSTMGSLANQNQCPVVRDDQLLAYKSPNPSKLGDVVNIKTLVKQSICVIDSQGKQMFADLEPNMAQAFRGAPPFVVSAQDLDGVEMYFQGWRVRLPNPSIKSLKLIEVAIP
jgi:transcriptional regulator with XRE-family HTH domain